MRNFAEVLATGSDFVTRIGWRLLRLVLQRSPAAAAERQRRKRVRKSRMAGHQIDPSTEIAAGQLMLLTSLPRTAQPAARVTSAARRKVSCAAQH